MSIKKITNPEEFAKIWKDLDALFANENEKYGHAFFKISAQSVINSWSHPSLLANTMHTWASINNEKADGIIMFLEGLNTICAEKIWIEYFWISANPKASFKLLKVAEKFAKSRKIKFMTMNCVENYPKSFKLKKVYQKLGFKKDYETYIKKL
ncbi:MAG: hypothetical protein ACO3EE_04965 [Flavobacteriales bacterium]